MANTLGTPLGDVVGDDVTGRSLVIQSANTTGTPLGDVLGGDVGDYVGEVVGDSVGDYVGDAVVGGMDFTLKIGLELLSDLS